MYVTNIKKTNNLYFLFLFLFFILFSCNSDTNQYKKLQGNVFGTTFLVKYLDHNQRDFTKDIAQLFHHFNNSLSTYHPNSTISKLNKGAVSIEVDTNFKNVFLLAKKVHQKTEGYFDPTIGKMVNAWGFGPNKKTVSPTTKEVDSLMKFVNFNHVTLNNSIVSKKNAETELDFNAIAKGYGVDIIGKFLESKNITNYLVEIGGEIRARGKNATGNNWSVGIEEPNFDGTRSITKITQLQNESIATSGNYRKFKIDSNTGKKIAHTLNPKTGFPASTDMLSASVIAPINCGEVDAYATAFMAMGFKKAKEIALNTPNMNVFFIYLENNKLKTYASKNLRFK